MMELLRWRGRSRRLFAELKAHFGQGDLTQLSIATREFPQRVRADLQRVMESLFEPPDHVRKFLSVRQEQNYAEITFSGLLSPGWMPPAVISPPEYEEIDIGEDRPVRCLKAGLWLAERNGAPYAVLMSPAGHHGMVTGISFQIATAGNEASADIAESTFRKLESGVQQGRCYRGKVLSLEMQHSYTGQSTGIKVHKLPPVNRDQVVLSDKTLTLLDRNIVQFVQRRAQLASLGQATRKGILFYGPPGTGKTYTIRC